MYYVYIIRNENQRFYCGWSANLRERLKSHNLGFNTSTKGHQWQVVYYEAYVNQHSAKKRERALKHHGKAYQSLIKRICESLE